VIGGILFFVLRKSRGENPNKGVPPAEHGEKAADSQEKTRGQSEHGKMPHGHKQHGKWHNQ
jgi:hypothetical protein